eukprot:COSAG04_NODE_640_length_11672_cov_32.635358_5_plen_164_part_00
MYALSYYHNLLAPPGTPKFTAVRKPISALQSSALLSLSDSDPASILWRQSSDVVDNSDNSTTPAQLDHPLGSSCSNLTRMRQTFPDSPLNTARRQQQGVNSTKGSAQTAAYTALIAVGKCEAVVLYDLLPHKGGEAEGGARAVRTRGFCKINGMIANNRTSLH